MLAARRRGKKKVWSKQKVTWQRVTLFTNVTWMK